MNESNDSTVKDRRHAERANMDGAVQVHFAEQDIVGPGQNISGEGVFFVAEGALRVQVEVAGTGSWRDAEVVRVQSMGDGKVGIAVKFINS